MVLRNLSGLEEPGGLPDVRPVDGMALTVGGRGLGGGGLPGKLSVAVIAFAAAEEQVLPRLLPAAHAFRLVVAVDVVQEASLRGRRG